MIKSIFKNELEKIKGIGKKTAQDLLLQFRSVNAIKKSSKNELAEAIGESKASLIFSYFHS
jgi:excinuclease ABC subunit C